MNEDLPFGSDTDEAVSALVDGELGAFAIDHGVEEAAARARLESWAGLATRRRELERVRAAVGDVPGLDDITRRRLSAHAASARRQGGSSPATEGRARPHRRTWLVIGGAAAAGILVVAAIAFTRTDDRQAATSKAASQAGSGAGAVDALRARGGEPYVGDVGDVTDPAALRATLERAGVFRTTGDASPQAAGASPGPGTDTSAARTCAQRLTARDGPAAGKRVVLLADASVAGAPAVVVAVVDRGRVVAFVISRPSCEVVSAQSL